MYSALPGLLVRLCLQAAALFKSLPSLVDIAIPDDAHFTVCGDVHGQYYDLVNIFELNGMPSETNPFLFNGARDVLAGGAGAVHLGGREAGRGSRHSLRQRAAEVRARGTRDARPLLPGRPAVRPSC